MSASASHFLRHDKLRRRRGRDLRQMRDAKHLMFLRQRAHLRADRVGDFAPTLASISSKTSTGIASCIASEDLIASIKREISPLDATVRNGLSGSPGLARKAARSTPCR